MAQKYERRGIYKIEDVLPFIKPDVLNKDSIRIYDGCEVKMNSERYFVFATKGTKCIRCGIKGKYFALEKDRSQKTKRWHFNLYALDAQGNEVLMTKDHIFPNGNDNIGNLQPMCIHCNAHKGRMEHRGSQFPCKDFCPLCGSRFLAKSRDGLFNLITEHNKWCEQNFVPYSEALRDDCFEAREPTKVWKTT